MRKSVFELLPKFRKDWFGKSTDICHGIALVLTVTFFILIIIFIIIILAATVSTNYHIY